MSSLVSTFNVYDWWIVGHVVVGVAVGSYIGVNEMNRQFMHGRGINPINLLLPLGASCFYGVLGSGIALNPIATPCFAYILWSNRQNIADGKLSTQLNFCD